MSNILDYLKWRQDLSFESDYFNCVDSLVLSRAAYLRWELIFSKIDKCTISKAYEIFNEYDLSTIHILAEEDPELFKLLATSKRFKDCEVSNFVNEVDEVKETQFCGLMFHLSDGTNYIAFRGTDNTIVGWKEDLKMSFQDSVISQKKQFDI